MSKNNISSNISQIGSSLLKSMHPNYNRSEIFYHISRRYGSNKEHAIRIEKYLNAQWFTPSSPILANLVHKNEKYPGHPISCFLSEASNLYDIAAETSEISYGGGGLGTVWNTGTSLFERNNDNLPNNPGVVPMMISQGRIMRYTAGKARKVGSICCWLSIDHGDAHEFLYMRHHRYSNDDDRKAPRYLHHGIILTKEFMLAVEKNKDWHFSDKSGNTIGKVQNARKIFDDILRVRLETGEPFIMFQENVDKQISAHHKTLGLKIKTSNLCTEITLITGVDHHKKIRTAVCCLGSINLMHWHEIKDNMQFFIDLYEFYDNILTIFIHEATYQKIGDIYHSNPEFVANDYRAIIEQTVNYAMSHNIPLKNAIWSSYCSRDVGVGVVGFQYLLQSLSISITSPKAREINNEIFKLMRERADIASFQIGKKFGNCPDYDDAAKIDPTKFNSYERFSYKLAIAPTTTLSYVMNTSPGVELTSPVTMYKFQQGFTRISNPYLIAMMDKRNTLTEDNIRHIAKGNYKGIISQDEFNIIKGGYTDCEDELMATVNLAGDRQKYIDQSQSINLYISDNTSFNLVRKLHYQAYKVGVKTLYYLRSTPNTLPADHIPEQEQSTCEACE